MLHVIILILTFTKMYDIREDNLYYIIIYSKFWNIKSICFAILYHPWNSCSHHLY